MRPEDCLFDCFGDPRWTLDQIEKINKELLVWRSNEYHKMIDTSRVKQVRESLIKYYSNKGWKVSEWYGDLCHPDLSPWQLSFVNPNIELKSNL